MKKNLILACSLCLVGAERQTPRTATPTPPVETATAELTADELAVFHEHFRQFGGEYQPPLTVAEQIETLGLVDPIIFNGRIERDEYRFDWDSASQSLTILVNGERPRVLDTVDDKSNGRLYWTALVPVASGSTRRPKTVMETRSGWLLATGESFVIQISDQANIYRLETFLPAENQTAAVGSTVGPVVSAAAVCGCRNSDGTGACTDKECDDAAGCGTGSNGTCFWRPGNFIAY
ncbi:MAG: hypothetical protein HYT46_02950 [Candidatus Vogelbacteria bacterium]|nr:hypothetical protein [Candidatus Vogelbacteria bacterium]